MKLISGTSGQFTVGCCDIVDNYGVDRLLFRLFYPIDIKKKDDSILAPWLAEAEYANGFSDFLNLKLFSGIFRWFTSSVKINVLWNESFQLPKTLSKLPVIIFSHGLGGNRLCYSLICSELASNGYLVAAIEHADKSASKTYYLDQVMETCNEKVVKKWLDYQHVKSNSPNEYNIRNSQVHFRAKECSKLLNCISAINDGDCNFVQCGIDLSSFQNNIDLKKCAIMGHSFGAATSIAVLSNDDRFAVGVGLDAWMFPLDKSIYANIHPVPFLFINSENFHWIANIAGMRKLDADVFNTDIERKMVTLVGTVHQTHTDFPVMVGNNLLSKMFKLNGTTDPQIALSLNNSLTLSFIGKYLGLDMAKSIDDLIIENENLVYIGTNIKVDEERIKASKLEICQLHNNIKEST